jgi:hypothetical protein
MTVRAFAARIGVSDRVVSTGETGSLHVVPRQATQAALDTLLSVAGTEVRERFAAVLLLGVLVDQLRMRTATPSGCTSRPAGRR